MMDEDVQPDATDGNLIALALRLAFDHQVADLAAEQGDAETAWRFRQLAQASEQRLTQLAAQRVD